MDIIMVIILVGFIISVAIRCLNTGGTTGQDSSSLPENKVCSSFIFKGVEFRVTDAIKIKTEDGKEECFFVFNMYREDNVLLDSRWLQTTLKDNIN